MVPRVPKWRQQACQMTGLGTKSEHVRLQKDSYGYKKYNISAEQIRKQLPGNKHPKRPVFLSSPLPVLHVLPVKVSRQANQQASQKTRQPASRPASCKPASQQASKPASPQLSKGAGGRGEALRYPSPSYSIFPNVHKYKKSTFHKVSR